MEMQLIHHVKPEISVIAFREELVSQVRGYRWRNLLFTPTLRRSRQIGLQLLSCILADWLGLLYLHSLLLLPSRLPSAPVTIIFLMVGLVLLQCALPFLDGIQLRIGIPKTIMSCLLLLEVRIALLPICGVANANFLKTMMRNCFQVAQNAHVQLVVMLGVLHLRFWRPILPHHHSVAFRQKFLAIRDFLYFIGVIL